MRTKLGKFPFRLPDLERESYFKDWAQFDLAGDAWKDLLSSPTWGVCKHPQPEGELALKSETTPFPAYLKYSQGDPASLSLSESEGSFLPDLVLLHWNSSGPGGGWRFYFSKKFNHLPPMRYPPRWKTAAKRELSTSLDVFLPKEPLHTAFSHWNGSSVYFGWTTPFKVYLTYDTSLYHQRRFDKKKHIWSHGTTNLATVYFVITSIVSLYQYEKWKRNDVDLSPSE